MAKKQRKRTYGRKLYANNISGFKGVSRQSNSKCWQARICKDRKISFLGHFKTPEDAALAYDKAALKLFGKAALTNSMLGLL